MVDSRWSMVHGRWSCRTHRTRRTRRTRRTYRTRRTRVRPVREPEDDGRPARRLGEQFQCPWAQRFSKRVPQQLGRVVLPQPPREQLADRQRVDWRPRLRPKAEQLVLEWQPSAPAAHRGVHTGRVAARAPSARRGSCAATRSRRPGGAPASETADRSRSWRRPAAPTGAPTRLADTAPSATGGRAPAGSRPNARRRRLNSANTCGTANPSNRTRRPRAGRQGGVDRLKAEWSGASTTSQATAGQRVAQTSTAAPLAAFERRSTRIGGWWHGRCRCRSLHRP